MVFKFNPSTGRLDLVLTLSNPLQYKGSVGVASDFPTLAEVEQGWFYRVTASVTDDDGSKTNTGQSFVEGDEIVWNGSSWDNLGSVFPSHDELSNLDYASAGHTGFEPTVTKGDLTETTSNLLTITGGTNSVIGSGVTIEVDDDLSNYSNATSGFLTAITGESIGDLSDVDLSGIAEDKILQVDASNNFVIADAPDTSPAGNDTEIQFNDSGSFGASSNIRTGNLYLDPSSIPSGAGTRLMWLPSKYAFRAGYAGTTTWDSANIGDYSVAFGKTNRASGDYSFASGSSNIASGDWSFSVGVSNNLQGNVGIAIGESNLGNSSVGITMIGKNNDVNNYSINVIGIGNDVDGENTNVIGRDNDIDSTDSNVLGNSNEFSGNKSSYWSVMGDDNSYVGNTYDVRELSLVGSDNTIKENTIGMFGNLKQGIFGYSNELDANRGFAFGNQGKVHSEGMMVQANGSYENVGSNQLGTFIFGGTTSDDTVQLGSAQNISEDAWDGKYYVPDNVTVIMNVEVMGVVDEDMDVATWEYKLIIQNNGSSTSIVKIIDLDDRSTKSEDTFYTGNVLDETLGDAEISFGLTDNEFVLNAKSTESIRWSAKIKVQELEGIPQSGYS